MGIYWGYNHEIWWIIVEHTFYGCEILRQLVTLVTSFNTVNNGIEMRYAIYQLVQDFCHHHDPNVTSLE